MKGGVVGGTEDGLELRTNGRGDDGKGVRCAERVALGGWQWE